MNRIQAIELEGIAYFKEKTRFEFEPGATFIQGRNLQRRGPQASNGSGKSLLFGVLPNLLFDSHATITKNSRSVARQLFTKNSSASVDFEQRKHKYIYSKAGSKTSLSRDGKNLQSRIARDQLKSLIDLSEEEFFSTVYLDSRRNNSFQMGTSSERFAFVTELFRLQDIDALRLHASRNITELKSESRVLDQAESELASLRLDLKNLPREAQEEADSISAWLKTASLRAQRLTVLQHQWETYTRWEKENEKLTSVVKPEHGVKETRAAISEFDGYAAKLDQWKKHKKSQQALQAEFEGLDVDDADYDSMLERRSKLVPCTSPEEPKGDIENAKKLSSKLDEERTHKYIISGTAKLRVLQKQLATFDSETCDVDQCPTCHSSLTAKTKSSIRSLFLSQIEATEAKLKTVKRVHLAHKLIAERVDYEKALKTFKAFSTESKAINAYPFEKAARYRELKAQLSSPNRLKRPDAPVSVIGSSLEALDAALVRANEYQEQKNLVKALYVPKPDQTIDTQAISKLNAAVSEKMGQLPAIQARASERKLVLRQIKALKLKIHEIGVKISDLPVYQLLVDAYSTKGIKMLMVQRIAKALEKNLNRYSRQVFSEDFKFAFSVVDGKFDVNVTRRMGKREVTSDIRHLSGAESRLFVFLFVLSLLPLIPDRRRMNILVLDEPDANLDPETREIFRDVLIPKLAKIVPSLIIISPNKDIVPQHARVYTVVKDGGTSRLQKGFVT
jgi:DNA repair exonuclease SbcCD ATPase subunit